MINLRIVGAAALLAVAPIFVSTADAQHRGGGGGGGGFSRGGGGGGGAFRGGGVALNPGFGGSRVGNLGRPAMAGAAVGALSSRPAFAGRPVAAMSGQRWAGGNRGYWRHGRHWRGPGFGFASGLALGAIGSSYYYNDPYYYGDSYAYADDYVGDEYAVTASGGDAAYCAQRYKSYDPASGTYLNL